MNREHVTKPIKFPIYKRGKFIGYEKMRIMIRDFEGTADDPEIFDLYCFTDTIGFHLYVHGHDEDMIYYKYGFNTIKEDYVMNRHQLRVFNSWMNTVHKKDGKPYFQLIFEKWYELNKGKDSYVESVYRNFFDESGNFLSVDFTRIKNLQNVYLKRFGRDMYWIFSDRGIFKFTRSNWFYCVRQPISAFQIRFCR